MSTVYRVTGRRGVIEVESDLSHCDAAALVAQTDSAFGCDLADQHQRSLAGQSRPLSEKQIAWLHVLAIEERDRRAKAGPLTQQVEAIVTDEAQMDRLTRMFTSAWVNIQANAENPARVKPPQVRIAVQQANAVAQYLIAQDPKNPGAFTVKQRGGRSPLARLNSDGILIPLANLKAHAGLVEALTRFCTDPEESAREYARLLGCCTFCGLQLTDERSLKVYRGAICSAHWNLPWGEK